MGSCIKCGSDAVSTLYVDKGCLIDSSSIKKVDDELVQSSEYSVYYKLTAKKEHLSKHCRNCQYSWREVTKIERLQNDAKLQLESMRLKDSK